MRQCFSGVGAGLRSIQREAEGMRDSRGQRRTAGIAVD